MGTKFTDFGAACWVAMKGRPPAKVFRTPEQEFELADESSAETLRAQGWHEFTPEEVAAAAKRF